MELAVAALGSLLPKLATLLTDEYKPQKAMRGEVRFLQAEMESMQAALNRVSMLPPQQIDDLLNIWVRDLKELSYDIEDSVDAFVVWVNAPGCAKPHSFRRFFDRTVGLLTKAKARHHITDDIQEIKRRIRDVCERKERYNIFDVAVVQPHTIDIDPCLPALYEDAAKLVGIDVPTQKVIDLLNRGKCVQNEKLMVLSIAGVGGLGKTTVANSVFQRLREQFQCKAFVSVSLKPNMKKILSSILRQIISNNKCTNAREEDPDELIKSIWEFLVNNNCREMDPDELIKSIRQFLVDKRYMLYP
ncbi:putative disease resistance protein At1g50180 [Sorghum bicolor]|uniref:putative disease resistance protein At1g50180 n=1 Tax=Sorghum bicolor TaxID=4558 RepID=UPI000B425C52|nr:putative disease resistance protein At1g50180 [Sorghum bicolor]|eukprot:XP_021317671.1 putative disease resistance protein At1g50180 [Sorghum bicolor]